MRNWSIVLVVSCVASLCLALPTLNNNADDPNMITYFNWDEGQLMDLMWFYYSGEKRDSFYSGIDYGVEMMYLADLAKTVPKGTLRITPGSLILVMRWLHMLFWIASLIALWFFVGYHFGRGWPQVAAVGLLATRPAFGHFLMNAKPDPLVLFLMILGLHFVLKMIDRPSLKYVVISVMLSAAAFIIKFAGIFLFPAIIAAMYLAGRKGEENRPLIKRLRYSWILEFFAGIVLLIFPFLYILFYRRYTSGLTYFEEFGMLRSLIENKPAWAFLSLGVVLILFSAVMLIFERLKLAITRNRVFALMGEINSYALLVVGIFTAMAMAFGIGFLRYPHTFLATYSYTLFNFLGVFAIRSEMTGNIFNKYLMGIADKITSFGILIICAFMIYLLIEIAMRRKTLSRERNKTFKRLVLIVFLVPFILSFFTMGRLTQYHTLFFFISMVVLILEGIRLISEKGNGVAGNLKWPLVFILAAFLLSDMTYNGIELVKSRLYSSMEKEDIAYEARRWWNENISKSTAIASEHYCRVYVPLGFENVRIFKRNLHGGKGSLEDIVEKYNPQLIYYNEGRCGDEPMPPVEEMLPGRKVEIVKVFEQKRDKFQRYADDRLIILRIR